MYINPLLFKLSGTAALEGKLVKWTAPAGEGNKPYMGVAKITLVIPQDSHPIHAETIEGNDLNPAFWDGEFLAYSDGDRYVDIEFLK